MKIAIYLYVLSALGMLFFCTPVIAQNKEAALQSIWEDTSKLDTVRFKALDDYHHINNHSQPDSAIVALDYYYNLAKEKKATRHVFRALNRKANIFRLKGQFEESRDLYNQAADVAIKLESPVLQATITGNIGNIFLKQQNYQEATLYYSSALKVFQEQKNKKGEGRMLLSLGSVYMTIGHYDLALEYYEKSLPIYKNIDPKESGNAIILMNIGWIHHETKMYVEAKDSFLRALEILQIKNEKFYIAGCYSSLAKIHHKLEQLDEANKYAEKSLVLNKELNLESGIMESLLIIAQLTYETNIDEATKKGEVILARLTPTSTNSLKEKVYKLLYKCYKTQNKLGLSLKMHEFYTIYNDSTQLEKNNFAVAREVVKNDFEVKLYETQLENEKAQTDLKLSQLKRTFAIITASALLIGIILFFFRKQALSNRKKRDALLEELEHLKKTNVSTIAVNSGKFELDKDNIELSLDRKINQTDWTVLQILLEDPVIPNKEIAEKAFLSVDGIGSSLRRMYEYFEIKESKYKKISLLLDAIKRSNKTA